MTADTGQEIAQIIEAASYVFGAVVFLIAGIAVGGYIPGFIGRKTSAKRTTHRTLLLSLSAGAFFASYGIWSLSEEGADFVRPDGQTSEWGRQVAIGIASLAIIYAYSMYSRYTHSAMLIMMFVTTAMYAFMTFASISSNSTQWWIALSFWFVSLVYLGVFGFMSINIKPTWIYANYVAGALFLVFAILQGLWLILSVQVGGEISLVVEAGLYTATDILLLGIVGLIMAFSFAETEKMVNGSGENIDSNNRMPSQRQVRNARGMRLRQR